jgi:hypothetical protein
MASRRSSQLSYSRERVEYSLGGGGPEPPTRGPEARPCNRFHRLTTRELLPRREVGKPGYGVIPAQYVLPAHPLRALGVEPMNGLDPAGILELRRLIRELVDEGRTVLLSSHLLDEVQKICDMAAIVDDGKIVVRHGMVALAIALTAGVAVLVFAVTGVQHASNSGKYGPAGGLVHYRDAVGFLVLMILVVGAIVGSTAGAADLESGVFRDLAATGRSRVALFGSRIPGAWAIVLPIAAGAAAIAAVVSVALAGSNRWQPPAPER